MSATSPTGTRGGPAAVRPGRRRRGPMRIAANARDHTLGDPRARYPLAVLFWLGLLGPAVVVAVGHSPLTGVAVALAGLLGAIGVGTACAGRAALRWIPVAAAPLIGIGCAFGAHALL